MAKDAVYYAGGDLADGSGVMTQGTQRGQRYHLTLAQLRKLTPQQHPSIDPTTGRTKLVPHDGTPYRILLAMEGNTTPGAVGIPGFGVRVGKTKNTFEVQVGTGVGTKTRRETLGSVMEMTIEEAVSRALATRKAIKLNGESPKRAEKIFRQSQEVQGITVGACLERYIAKLERQRLNGQTKASSVEAARDSLARISRVDVGLAKVQVRDLFAEVKNGSIDEHPMVRYWNKCRLSCMRNSNRLDDAQKNALAAAGNWWKLDAVELEKLGFKGKHIQRAKAAGLAAVEHTFGDINRAIDLVIAEEAQRSILQKRQPELVVNPTRILYEEGFFRDHTQLRAHYRKAQVRNPLGEAEEDQSLQRAMKALIHRRDYATDSHQKVGVDYLFIVLLWGLRRNEGTVLRWYEDCTAAQLAHEEVSWVWLAPGPDARNPTTGMSGSQAFLHDTKTGVVQHIPICYFAERILRVRWDDRLETLEGHQARLAKAKAELVAAQSRTHDEVKLAVYRKAIRREEFRRANSGWVFPARSIKAKEGHYKDSKSLLVYLREATGRVDLSRDIDVGLTVHDFRRTMGRFASKLLSGRMVSELLKHHQSKGADGDAMSATTERYYSDQEWADVRRAMAQVEESIIQTSPRVWNRLKGPDKPVLDEVNDPPVELATPTPGGSEEEE